MNILVASDLHIDTHGSWSLLPLATNVDAYFLPGDWANGRFLMDEGFIGLPEAVYEKPVFALPGNHEYYGLDLATHRVALGDKAREAGLTWLDQTRVEWAGWTILGCTLWSDFALHGNPDEVANLAGGSISDFRLIRLHGRSFQPAHARGMYASDHAWLTRELGLCDPERTIVMTHFGPHPHSTHPYYKRPEFAALNPYFVNNSGLIEAFQPRYWFHGHTHMPLRYRVGRTDVICNPRGYPGEKQPDTAFNPNEVIAL